MKIPIRGTVSVDRLMQLYSRDFQAVYEKEAPWTNYMLVYLSVRFLAREGLKKYRELPADQKKSYPGVQKFAEQVEKSGEAWSYAAEKAIGTLGQKHKRESFRSSLNFLPFQNFALGKWLKIRLSSDRPLPDFGSETVEAEFSQPILKSMALILTAQYYLKSYQQVTEPTILDDHYNRDMSWIIDQWNQNYLRVRSIWKPSFDLAVLSIHTLSPLYEPAGQKPVGQFRDLNPVDRSYGRSTLPFQDIYDVSTENIPPRIRDLQTNAIQEFIENRLHSGLRRWLKCLTYAIKFRLFEELTQKEFEEHDDVNFYARNALQDINNVIEMN